MFFFLGIKRFFSEEAHTRCKGLMRLIYLRIKGYRLRPMTKLMFEEKGYEHIIYNIDTS